MADFVKKTVDQWQEEKQALYEMVNDGAESSIKSNDDLNELLDFMARFPERSFTNQLLIKQQYPDAEAVITREELKENGIYIKKNEKGSKIFERKVTERFKDINDEWKGINKATSDELEQIQHGDIVTRKQPHYNVATVFDVKQTQLKDYSKVVSNRVWDKGSSSQNYSELENVLLTNEKYSEVAASHDSLQAQIDKLAELKLDQMSKQSTEVREFQKNATKHIVSKHFNLDGFDNIQLDLNDLPLETDNHAKEFGKIMNDVSRAANSMISDFSKDINYSREHSQEKVGKEFTKPDYSKPLDQQLNADGQTEKKEMEQDIMYGLSQPENKIIDDYYVSRHQLGGDFFLTVTDGKLKDQENIVEFRQYASEFSSEREPKLLASIKGLDTEQAKALITNPYRVDLSDKTIVTENIGFNMNIDANDFQNLVEQIDKINPGKGVLSSVASAYELHKENYGEVTVNYDIPDLKQIENRMPYKEGFAFIDTETNELLDEDNGRSLAITDAELIHIKEPSGDMTIEFSGKSKYHEQKFNAGMSDIDFYKGNNFKFNEFQVREAKSVKMDRLNEIKKNRAMAIER